MIDRVDVAETNASVTGVALASLLDSKGSECGGDGVRPNDPEDVAASSRADFNAGRLRIASNSSAETLGMIKGTPVGCEMSNFLGSGGHDFVESLVAATSLGGLRFSSSVTAGDGEDCRTGVGAGHKKAIFKQIN